MIYEQQNIFMIIYFLIKVMKTQYIHIIIHIIFFINKKIIMLHLYK